MKSNDLTISYAQFNEDITLMALFHDVKQGFYVDVGANYPVVDSVTMAFYEMGWSGINIEPITSLYDMLCKARKRDTNLRIGVADKPGIAEFREYVDMPGHSTFQNQQKSEHEGIKYTDYEVPVKTLKQVFEENKVGHIHFLKIDVEGFEFEVISGADFKKFRPEVICIEANHIQNEWKRLLEKADYKSFIFDGLNEYFVAKEAWGRTENYGERAANLSYKTIKKQHVVSWDVDKERLKFLEDFTAKQDAHIKGLTSENAHLKERLAVAEPLSMAGKDFPHRVKIALEGTTIDYLRNKRSK